MKNSHYGKSRNLTAGNAAPENSWDWTLGATFPLLTFAGVPD